MLRQGAEGQTSLRDEVGGLYTDKRKGGQECTWAAKDGARGGMS